MMPRRALVLAAALLLLAFHGGLAATWLHRSPAPISSPHANDHAALIHGLTLAGRADLGALEAGMLGQEDCSAPPPGGSRWDQLRGTLRSDPGTTFRNKTPLAYLLGALAPLLMGFGPLTVRAGTLLLLALLAACSYAVSVSAGWRDGALPAACAVTLLPLSVGGVQTLFPTLGCVAGAALALALLMASDRFRRPGVALLAGIGAALVLGSTPAFLFQARQLESDVVFYAAVLAGVGGLVNITQTARRLVFCGTFTAGGLSVSVSDGNLRIEREGKVRKFVRTVEQLSFSAARSREVGQDVLYVTERAVLRLSDDGLELIEVAPGIDIDEQVLGLMDFKPIVRNVRPMPAHLFGYPRG